VKERDEEAFAKVQLPVIGESVRSPGENRSDVVEAQAKPSDQEVCEEVSPRRGDRGAETKMDPPGFENLPQDARDRLMANRRFREIIAKKTRDAQHGMGIADMIWQARVRPPKPVVSGLLNEEEIAGLHGAPEVFKTIFTLQLAESLATGKPFLGVWKVPKPRRVYFFETEMSVAALGDRLRTMYAGQAPPNGVYFADEARLKQFRRAADLQQKFGLLKEWVREVRAEVLMLDTANPFFRGKQSPNDETTAGAFFDLLAEVPAKVELFVRHNHKPRIDDSGGDAAAKIRGSGQFSDVPDLLLELCRPDKRTNEASLSVSKFRHGSKPYDLTLWLDAGTLRLVSIPPVPYLLLHGQLTRSQLLEALNKRFGIGQRLADELIRAERVKDEGEPVCLIESRRGHENVLEIDWEQAIKADWYPRIGGPSRGGTR
jgi:hypothetical protein